MDEMRISQTKTEEEGVFIMVVTCLEQIQAVHSASPY